MREILFRGKRRDDGKWIEGGFFTREEKCYIFVRKRYMPDTRDCDAADYYENHPTYKIEIVEVIPVTVGQYTGLTDKSGTKIFEGDILRDDDSEENGVVAFFEGEYCVSFNNEFTYGFADIACSCYVIGNIHDNPELLKGGTKK